MKPRTKKLKYEKPAMWVYEFSHQPRLLVGSGGLDDYNRPNNPYNW